MIKISSEIITHFQAVSNDHFNVSFLSIIYGFFCFFLSLIFFHLATTFFLFYVLFLSPDSSVGQPSSLKEGSLSNTVVPEKKMSATCTPPDIHSGPTVALELLTLVLPPQRLSEAEVPLWKVLEGRSGKDSAEKYSVKEGTKPLCGG